MLGVVLPGIALPPPEDVPEEILRTEIITEARSPIDGTPISASQYAALQEDLPTEAVALSVQENRRTQLQPVSPEDSIINKLPIRDLLRAIFPF